MEISRTTGPLYVEPKYRDGDNLFGLLLSNMVGIDIEVQVKLYAAPFTAVGTPEPWMQIVDTTVVVPDETVANVTFPVQCEFPYYQFFIYTEIPQACFHQSLYLLDNLVNAVQDFPLVPDGDWEDIGTNLPG